MAGATKTVEVSVPRDKFWQALVDYESYPQFVEGVAATKVLSREGGRVQVEFKVSMLGKDLTYVLDHTENKPDEITWNLVSSSMFKSNEGSWKLRDLGKGRTEVTYSLSLDFTIYVPGLVLKGLVGSQLPKMISQFEKRALST